MVDKGLNLNRLRIELLRLGRLRLLGDELLLRGELLRLGRLRLLKESRLLLLGRESRGTEVLLEGEL